ncbi:MAG: hypothetical protein K8T90_06995 [Planctomycetes bacterium]|nr:hypothetical protein [Planctomycetota bacterium]
MTDKRPVIDERPGDTDAAPELAREKARDEVRKGGRLIFHATVTLASAAVAGAAEALGNVLFRGGNDLLGMTLEGAVFGFLIGNLLALWLWPKMVDRI